MLLVRKLVFLRVRQRHARWRATSLIISSADRPASVFSFARSEAYIVIGTIDISCDISNAKDADVSHVASSATRLTDHHERSRKFVITNVDRSRIRHSSLCNLSQLRSIARDQRICLTLSSFLNAESPPRIHG